MNKKEFISAVAEESKLNLSQDGVNKVVDAVFKVITDILVSGQEANIFGFGKFEVVDRAAKLGRNPSTNEPINIEAKRVPRFKAGKALKDIIMASNSKTKK